MVFVRFHDFNNEIGHLLYVREDALDDLLHVTLKKTLAILADEDEVAFEVELMSVLTCVHRPISLRALNHALLLHSFVFMSGREPRMKLVAARRVRIVSL